MSSVLIRFPHIPSYLHNGEFYRSLNAEDEESWIKIPEGCFKPDDEVTNLQHFANLLRVTIFWDLDDIPESVLDYCYSTDVYFWRPAVLSLMLPGDEESTLFRALLAAFQNNGEFELKDIIETNRWDLINYAIKHIDLELVRNVTVTTKAAGLGNLRVLQLLHTRGFLWHEHTANCASYHGKLDCLRYVHNNGCPWDSGVYKSAIFGGHMDCLKYAHQQGLAWDAELCCIAAMEGRLDFLQYLHEKGCPWDERVCERAAEHGHYDCLRFAHQLVCPWSSCTVLEAARNGHVKCLRYALLNNCPLHEQACEAAAFAGRTDSLQFLGDYLFQLDLLVNYWTVNLTKAAAYCKDVACVEFLHTSGCPWDEDLVDVAAEQGNFDVLRYAIENGCEVSTQVVQFAASAGSLPCLQYLLEDKLLVADMNGSVFLFALLKGSLPCVQYLIDHDCPFTTAEFGDMDQFELDYNDFFCVDSAVNGEFAKCVRLAVDRGYALNQALIDFMVANDYTNCREYLIEAGCIDADQEYSSAAIECKE